MAAISMISPWINSTRRFSKKPRSAIRSYSQRVKRRALGWVVGMALTPRMHPFGLAALPVLFLPDRHQFLEPVDGMAARIERLGAMWAAHGVDHADVADFQVPQPMFHDH